MRNRKRISILLVLAMVMTMLTGFAAPAGATTPVAGVVIGHVPTVVGTGHTTLASIRFAESGASIGNIQTGDQITITLPSGVTFRTAAAVADVFVAGPNMGAASASFNAANTAVTLTVYRTPGTDFLGAAFTATLPVDVTTVGSGAVNVTVASTSTAISDGTFAVATFGTGAITMDGTGTVGTVSRFALAPQNSAITVRLAENAPGAFRPNTVTGTRLVLELPEGVTWAANPTGQVGGSGFTATVASNARRLNVEITSATTARTTFTLSGIALNVTRLAALGDLTVTVTGEGDNSGRVSGSVVLARVADFGIDVLRPTTGATTVPTINAGRMNAADLNNMIEVKEATAGSLIAGGTITLTLPGGVRFAAEPTTGAAGIALAANPLSNSNRTVTFNVATDTNPRTVRFTFPANSLLFSPTVVAGDVAVTVAGTAGASGTVNIATARSTFAVAAATAPTVALGSAAQGAADIVITEAAFGRIRTGNLELELPTGFIFSGTPTVTRTSGNITLGAATLLTNNILRIPVDAVSAVASVITVSGIRYDVSRTAMDGPVNVAVTGSSLGEAAVLAAFDAAVAGNRPRVTNARVGLPVVPRPVTVFTIGALSFVRDGVTTAIDAAPAIVEGRTLLPLRFAALAVGVNEDDILWDSVRRTVTLLRGDRVVQLRIGDRNMTINGVVVPLEVPASIQNGRTVLPIRAIAQALRASVVWDGTARTVTVTAQ